MKPESDDYQQAVERIKRASALGGGVAAGIGVLVVFGVVAAVVFFLIRQLAAH